MKDTHTPGPWHLATDGRTIAHTPADPDAPRLIARVGGPKQKGDARLIAAAPELLDALQRIKGTTDPARMWQIASDALAKVKS
jgi:hypothetical protein